MLFEMILVLVATSFWVVTARAPVEVERTWFCDMVKECSTERCDVVVSRRSSRDG